MKFDNAHYKYSTIITHQGTVIAFAARSSDSSGFEIGYTVLSPSSQTTLEDQAWTDFNTLDFPKELRSVGMSLITIDFGDTIPTADTPFQALSDGRHVYIFRQSAQNTLLVDRFVYEEVTQTLVSTWEVRYRRSKNANIPADRNDTFGTTDMNGNHFIEPTTELTMVNNLQGGWFSVLILPTSLQSIQRWQIFAYESATQSLNSFSFMRSQNGLFDLGDAIEMEGNQFANVPPENCFNLMFTEPYGGTTAPLQFSSGPSAILYAKQEGAADDKGVLQLLKREARVMVAAGVTADTDDLQISNQVAILDFGVGTDGKLAQISPDVASTSRTSTGYQSNLIRGR